jgi:hypothetical protein
MIIINLEEEMRVWLLECFTDEYEQEEINKLNVDELESSIYRYYDGGMESFIEAIHN